MNKVAILTDSTAYLPQVELSQYSIATIPLSVIWGEETFLDGVTLQPETFYQRLKTARALPGTSQPSVGAMLETFTRLLEQDYAILGIFLSSKLSGTVQSALQARDLLDVGAEKIEIFDSHSTTMAMGFQVLAAARAASDSASLKDCLAVAEQARQHTGVYFVVDTLEFLYRGGRIGGAQRFLGTALNMKPILKMQDGKIEALERVRTKGKALDRLADLVAEACQGKAPIHLATAHANAPAEAAAILQKASELLAPVETFTCELSPVIGTHAGPGTVALAYMAGM